MARSKYIHKIASVSANNIDKFVDGYIYDINLTNFFPISFSPKINAKFWTKDMKQTVNNPLRDFAFFSNGYSIFLVATLKLYSPYLELQASIYDQQHQQISGPTTICRLGTVNINADRATEFCLSRTYDKIRGNGYANLFFKTTNVKVVTFNDNSVLMSWSAIDINNKDYHIILQHLSPDTALPEVSSIHPSYNGMFSLDRFSVSDSFVVAFMPDVRNFVVQKLSLQNNQITHEYNITKYTHSDYHRTFVVKASPIDESFLVVWSYLDYRGIFAQKYDALGSRFGMQRNIITSPDYFKLAINEDGMYIIAWEEHDRVAQGAFAQIFDNNSLYINSRIVVNTNIDQALAAVDFLDNGRFVASFICEGDMIIQRTFFINGTLSGETTFELE